MGGYDDVDIERGNCKRWREGGRGERKPKIKGRKRRGGRTYTQGCGCLTACACGGGALATI